MSKMKSAKELFEELGYEINQNDKVCISYVKKNGSFWKYIDFSFKTKWISCDVTNNNGDEIGGFITMQELLAINKMVKELGWLDE